MRPRSGPHALKRLVAHKRVVLCVGSGGVGKTTTAAALALAAAASGRRALVITIDPARRLANALGLSSLEARPRRIEERLLVEAGLPRDASFSAMTLDLKAAWDHLVERTARDANTARRIQTNRLYRAVSTDLPGAQDFIACEALFTLAEDDAYDLIVLDTPPTQNALDFLDAPNRILDMLDNEAFRFFAEREASAASLLGLRFLDTAHSAVNALLSRFTGSSFLDELSDFLVVMRDLYAPVRERTRGLHMLLRSADSAFVVVTSPAPGPRREALAFLSLLEERGYPLGAIVANRVTPAPGDVADPRTLAENLVHAAKAEELAAAIARAHAEQARDAAHDEAALDEVRAHAPALPCVAVPRLTGDIADLRGLARLLPALVAEEPEPALD